MRLEATGSPFVYRWPGGEIRLEPGKPIELPDERAKRLLDKAPGRVRVIDPDIKPGACITWTRADGSIQTGFVDFLHTDPDDIVWAFVTMPNGEWAAVNLRHLQVIA